MKFATVLLSLGAVGTLACASTDDAHEDIRTSQSSDTTEVTEAAEEAVEEVEAAIALPEVRYYMIADT